LSELLRRTHKYLLPVLRRSWLVLAVTLAGCEFFHQFFSHMAHEAAETSSVAQIFSLCGELLVEMLEYTVFSLLIPQRIMELDKSEAPGSFWAFSFLHVKPLTIEGIRSFAVAIFWGFLLIVPGIIKYVRYTFVCFVVVADPEYQAGRVDALDQSERLIKGITLPLFIFILATTGLDYWQSALRETHDFLTAPLLALIVSLAFFAVNYYINILLFVLYKIRLEKAPARSPGSPAGSTERTP
jgi:hypothetical protein